MTLEEQSKETATGQRALGLFFCFGSFFLGTLLSFWAPASILRTSGTRFLNMLGTMFEIGG